MTLYRTLTHALLTLLALIFSGCASPRAPDRSMTVAAQGVAGIVAHTESAQRHVDGAKPHSNPTGRVLLEAASDEHSEVLVEASQVHKALAQAQTRFAQLAEELAAAHLDYARLEGKWYVVWGRRLEKAIWYLAIGWLVAGVLSVLLGLGSPLGWGTRLGKELVRLVPAMNVFAWVRNAIVRWRQRRESPRPAKRRPVVRRRAA